MRLGLESTSPSRAPQALAGHLLRGETALSSAFIPIDVNGESSDDAEPLATRPHSALASPVDKPSLSNLLSGTSTIISATKRRIPMALALQDEKDIKDDTEFSKSRVAQSDEITKPSRNFFLNVEDQIMSKKHHRSISCHRVSVRSSPIPDELHEVISAARTSICGQKFDRCELEFTEDRVELTIWKENKAQWQGQLKYEHMERFCFSRGKSPPYILLLELNSSKSRSDFATFYDPIFAKVCEGDEAKDQSTMKMYGVVFYFDEEMDYMRCQSMGDNNPRLAHLFRNELSESEVRRYLRSDGSGKLRRRINSYNIESATATGRDMASIVGNRARSALDSVTSFFRPTLRPSVLEKDENPSVIRDGGNSTRGRTVNFLRKGNEKVASDSSEGISSMLNKSTGNSGKQDRNLDADEGIKTQFLLQNTQVGEADVRATSLDTTLLQQDIIGSDGVESKKRAAASRRVEEQLKRKKLESRRNEVLLTYPYDGSDTSGRISVTLGDIDRLVPGEFLNDNIIDFYLRFLWRHLASWQQQQIYFFTSHFFTQLNGTNGAFELTQVDPNKRFARVARWTQKETNLFDKRFIFIPINDSFHWSIAVFCNPGSAIIKKHRRVIRRPVLTSARTLDERTVVDLVDGDGGLNGNEETSESARHNNDMIEDIKEEELRSCQDDRLANPPCLLFLDSLRCHRKEKFTIMLRNYLECEWKARYASSPVNMSRSDDRLDEEESIVTLFDSESIDLLEPNIPLQSNSSDCGVFLLMYAASIVHNFPAGITREDMKNNLSSTLTSSMFRDEHVQEFREYLQQLLFCLQFLEKHGISEDQVKDEGLEIFSID